jgi:hypothetical protein
MKAAVAPASAVAATVGTTSLEMGLLGLEWRGAGGITLLTAKLRVNPAS